jgi:TetR/AcrR family transcriptional regulator, repressor for neighboring sulfatase
MPATKRGTTKRQRRTPETVRAAALVAARGLLLRTGPEAITLPAIATELGMTHGNLTHHFGSVGALHSALVDQMASELAVAVNDAVLQLRAEAVAPIQVVDALFDAFSKNGAGRLISWLAATGNMEALQPLFTSVTDLVRELSRGAAKRSEDGERALRQNALVLIATALGNALIGDRLHTAVGLPSGTINELAAQDLVRRANQNPGKTKR